ncbi:type II toxin-antitoxin system RelE/ParE family toxin [Bradyrhizobium sp. 930_D9_N1_4]|uniref:type II toxin-antitoxin system RelE/ParE family toxin n=1 Tax=Bradyrhizobium sp. 930_D9_N1_4 TaxID=3240374 RepID=UPI003F8B6F8A
MKLRFTPRATQDLISIADYIHAHSPQGALRVRAAILESLQNLVRFPGLGRPQKVEGVRKLVTRRYPYLVYYKLDEEGGEVVILTIQHPARERGQSDA